MPISVITSTSSTKTTATNFAGDGIEVIEDSTQILIQNLIASDKQSMKKRKLEEHESTLKNKDGMAFTLVERLLALELADNNLARDIEPVSQDDLFFFTEKFLTTQANFKIGSQNSNATIGKWIDRYIEYDKNSGHYLG